VNRRLAYAGLFLLAAATGGCALTFDSAHLGVPVSLADSSRAPATGTPFKVTKHPVFFGWGLATVSQPNLEDVLAGQLATGASITKLRIKVGMRPADLLFTVLTFGLLSPRTVTFEGVVVPH